MCILATFEYNPVIFIDLFQFNLFFYTVYLQEIKRDNEVKGTGSCKIVLYRTFLQCGVRTWEQVIKALEKSWQGDFIEQVKLQLLKSYIEVINAIGWIHYM